MLSRRAFVRGGGALLVALSGGGAFGRAADAAGDPFASSGPADPMQADSYLAVLADNTALVKTGRVELGQGSLTGLLLLAAEELDLHVSQLDFVRQDTNVTPDTGGTFGSSSIAEAGQRLRAACAAARQTLLQLAAAQRGVPVAILSVSGGVVSGGGRSVTYGALLGGRLISTPLPAQILNPGQAPAKPISEYTLAGISRMPRLDIPAKVAGSYAYIQSVRVPGMLHGRIVRPLGQGAYGDGTLTNVLSVDSSSIDGIGDARIVRRGNFLGVVASKEYDAIQAASRLKVVYATPPEISGSGNLWSEMRALDAAGQAPARIQFLSGDVDGAVASAAHSVARTYAYHYQGHMPIGPSCAIGDVTATGAIVLCNTQDAYSMRNNLSMLLGLPTSRVRVVYYEGAGTFGNSPARFDTGEAAGVMSQLAGAPVRLQFMRWDEHGWDNYGPAVLSDMRGAVDGAGNLTGLDYSCYGIPSLSMLSDATTQNCGFPLQPPGAGSADALNSGTQYTIPNRRIIGKSLALWDTFFKTSALRAPHCPQTCFASEQLVDELAHVARMDPYEFRLQNIQTGQVNDGFGQWRDVLTGVARLAGWRPRVAAASLSNAEIVSGRGIALGGFASSQAGVVADIDVNRRTGKITARHLYVAGVQGFALYLPGIENQMEGNLVMGLSRALHEEVAFNRYRTTSLDWVTYPILRFAEAPKVSTLVIQRKDLASTGAGEPPTVPVAAAVANAFFDATGVRIRTAPMTPGRVRATLAAG
jgi:nicotinate dehydrogenase subunit B